MTIQRSLSTTTCSPLWPSSVCGSCDPDKVVTRFTPEPRFSKILDTSGGTPGFAEEWVERHRSGAWAAGGSAPPLTRCRLTKTSAARHDSVGSAAMLDALTAARRAPIHP